MGTQSTANKAVGHIAGIDLLRFCAALIVALYHMTVAIAVPSDSGIILGHRAAYPEAYRFAWTGFVGVEIFFVISGVVIAYSAMNQAPLRFLFSRALRLYPAAWVCSSISAVACGLLHIFKSGELLSRWGGSMLLLPIWTGIDSVYWTLGIEMVFYASVFLMLVFASPNQLYRLALALGMTSALYFLAGVALFPNFLVNHLFNWMGLSLLPYGIYFGLGMVLFLRRGRYSLLDVAFIVSALAAACVEIWLKTLVNHATFGTPQTMLPVLVFLVAVSSIVLSFRLPTPPRVTRVFRVVGLATYPFYLLHDVTGTAIMRQLLDVGLGRWEALGASLAIVVAASIAISQWIEPAIRSALGSSLSAIEGAVALGRARTAPTS